MTAEYDDDLFGEPIEPPERKIPRRGSHGYEKYFYELPLPNGWKFSSLAPTLKRLPNEIESIWVVDNEGEFRHLFVDRLTGQEYRPDWGRWSQ